MSDESALVVKIIKSFVCRVMICTKVMCCVPLDRIVPLRKASEMTKTTKTVSESQNHNETPATRTVTESKPSEISLTSKVRHPKIINFKTRPYKPSVKSSKNFDLDTDFDSNLRVERLRIKKIKKGGKKSPAVNRTPQSKRKHTKEFLKNIFITKRVFSDTDMSRNGNSSRTRSSAFQRSKEYFLEMFDHFT